MFFDTHSHLNFSVFDKKRGEIIKKCLENDVWSLNLGINYESSRKAVEIAQSYGKGIYAAVGLHPLNLGFLNFNSSKPENILEENFDYEKYKKLAHQPKVLAIGEIGLDYYRKPKLEKEFILFKQKQKEVLSAQLKLAEELNLPAVLHCRMAMGDLLEMLAKREKTADSKLKLRGVIHCFIGSWREAEKLLEMGFYLGFNGMIFKKIPGINFEEIIKKIPLEKILIETDSPYLSPPGFKEKNNNPLAVKIVAGRIAALRNMDYKKVEEITFQNAKNLFGFEI